jgi:hypothetical protein
MNWVGNGLGRGGTSLDGTSFDGTSFDGTSLDVRLIDMKTYGILCKIEQFFNDKEKFDMMYEIVNHADSSKPGVLSLRRIYTIMRRCLPAAKFDLYESAISACSKQLFDTFCRQNNPEGIITFTKHGKTFTTTVAQLNMFRMILSHEILTPYTQKVLRKNLEIEIDCDTDTQMDARMDCDDGENCGESPMSPTPTSNNIYKQKAVLVNAKTYVTI